MIDAPTPLVALFFALPFSRCFYLPRLLRARNIRLLTASRSPSFSSYSIHPNSRGHRRPNVHRPVPAPPPETPCPNRLKGSHTSSPAHRPDVKPGWRSPPAGAVAHHLGDPPAPAERSDGVNNPSLGPKGGLPTNSSGVDVSRHFSLHDRASSYAVVLGNQVLLRSETIGGAFYRGSFIEKEPFTVFWNGSAPASISGKSLPFEALTHQTQRRQKQDIIHPSRTLFDLPPSFVSRTSTQAFFCFLSILAAASLRFSTPSALVSRVPILVSLQSPWISEITSAGFEELSEIHVA